MRDGADPEAPETRLLTKALALERQKSKALEEELALHQAKDDDALLCPPSPPPVQPDAASWEPRSPPPPPRVIDDKLI